MSTPSFCSGCGGPLHLSLRGVEDNLSGETFSIARCLACGLGHTSPVPEDLEPYYGERYYGNRHGFTASYCTARRMRWVAQSSPPQPAGRQRRRLLDVGCGEGTFLLEAQRRGWEVYGTEINPEPARAAGLNVASSIEQLISFAPFTCITLWHSLEHISDPRAALGKLRGLLSPGGVILVAVPDAGGLHAALFGRHWFPLDVPRHIHHFTRQSLTRMLAGPGLTVTGKHHQEIEYDLYSFNMSVLKTFMKRPVDCFEFLVGRPRRVSRLRMAMTVLISAALVPVTLAMTFVGSLAGKGGTLILTSRVPPGGAEMPGAP